VTYDDAERSRRRASLEAKLEALELELERAHHLLDMWGLPREAIDPDDGHTIELSLSGRLELLPDA